MKENFIKKHSHELESFRGGGSEKNSTTVKGAKEWTGLHFILTGIAPRHILVSVV